MKKLREGIIVVVLVFVTACSTNPYNPYKPEMSVDQDPTKAKTYNRLYNDWEN